MSFVIPILIMDAILLVVTVLLAVADRLLVTYGECRISVTHEDEVREIRAQGGDYLHSILSENGIAISSSCGGKATCGYCKVQVMDGGGPMLPTEEMFMSRQEKREGMRLACQVKVKNDIDIHIPDFLTTVKNMVTNGTFDSKLRWRVRIDGRAPEEVEKQDKLALELGEDEEGWLCAVLEEHRDSGGAAVPVLQEINRRYNYLPESVVRGASEGMSVPLSSLFRLASFYNAFSLKPRGKYVITICTGTACHVKGASRLVSMLEEELGIDRESTTEDLLFTLRTVRCIGCCGLAPVLLVGDDVHGKVGRKKTLRLVEGLRKAEAETSEDGAKQVAGARKGEQ